MGITIKTLTLKKIETEYRPDLTIREYMLYICELDGCMRMGDTFALILLNNGKIINRFADRHRLVKTCMKDGDTLHGVSCMGSKKADISNNLMGGVFEKNDTCPVCLEKFVKNDPFDLKNKKVEQELSCLHNYHRECLIGLDRCPLCRKEMTQTEKDFVRYLPNKKGCLTCAMRG